MNNKPIGIFDSGVGGLSVLRTIKQMLPDENYIYYADFKNAPYGSKSKSEILDVAMSCMDYLIERNVKAVVVACNTATSAAIEEIRASYDIPIIGIEPAIKPASQNIDTGKTIVLATPATLKFAKFQKLYMSLDNEDVVPVACPELSKLIENAKPESSEIREYLKDIFSQFRGEKISAVVIGCTHFSFIEDDIKKVLGPVSIFDGRYGTARYLKKVLEDNDLLCDTKGETQLVSNDEKIVYQNLLLKFMQLPLYNKEY